MKVQAEIHRFKVINRAKNKKLPPKSTDWTADFGGSSPKTLTFHEDNGSQLAVVVQYISVKV